MISSDLQSAVAFLALAHKKLDPKLAARMLRTATSDDALVAALVTQVGESALLAAAAAELRIVFVDLHAHDTQWRPDEQIATTMDPATLKAYHVLPVRHKSGHLGVAMPNPRAQREVVDWVRSILGADVPLLIAPAAQIDARLVYLDSGNFEDVAPGEAIVEATSAAPGTVVSNPVVEFVDNLLARAVADGASDLHFLSQADGTLLVRFRVDGVMRRQQVPLRRREKEILGALLAKCGDNIDATDRTRPQDGTFSFIAPGGRRIDARLGMLPQAHGPTIVVRLLDPANINRRLEDMGFAPSTLEQMRRAAHAPQGSLLFAGPTGSGKTTTLYSLLKEIDATSLSVLTAEDPIEYRLPNIGQTQIRSDLGDKSLTFAKTLRSMLRLDPDVILVGEIRDGETAETAMHAALTGHLVLSTVHAKTAVAVYQRLEELGVDPYVASESLTLAVNQRLVRTVHTCALWEAPTPTDVSVLDRFGLVVPDRVVHARPGGCPGCEHSGYRGRAAVVEVMEPTTTLKELVAVRAPRSQVLQEATTHGYTSIMADAYRHVVEGRMPVMELLRVAGAGEA